MLFLSVCFLFFVFFFVFRVFFLQGGVGRNGNREASVILLAEDAFRLKKT